jgi:hypothetical protein
LHSMFKNVSLSINDVVVTQSVELYPYRAWLEAFLGYSDTAKSTHLAIAGWETGTRTFGIPTSSASHYINELQGRLHLDLTMVPNAIAPQTKITLKLYPNNLAFFINKPDAGHEEPTFHIQKAEFHVQRAKATVHLLKAHEPSFIDTPMRYPINRIEVKTASLPTGLLDYGLDNIHTGVLPSKVYAALISNKAFNGDYQEDPFDFKPYDLSYLAFTVGGELYPANGLNGQSIKEYISLLQVLNQNGHNTDLSYTFTNFKTTPIYIVNLEPDATSGSGATFHVNPKRNGDLGVRLKFKTAPLADKPVTLILWLEYENMIEIWRGGQVKINW